jgi:hypothetical protein
MRRTLAALAGLALLTGPALADNMLAPLWRGENNTVFAEWDTWTGFSTTGTPFYPDTWMSLPADLPTPDAQAYGTAEYLPTYESRNGVVELNDMYQIDFLMPNFLDFDLTEVWIQLTYWAAAPTEALFLVDTNPYTAGISGPYFEGACMHEFGWVTEAYSFTIQPGVSSELIALDFAGAHTSPVYLDQVVIDSIAVPEPTSLALAALLCLALVRRR